MNTKLCSRYWLVSASLILAVALVLALGTVLAKATAPPRSRAASLTLPGGSTISGTLTSDDTWGPGVITVTGDIWINAGVTIVITPGTTVRMALTDGLSGGADPTRVEYIVAGTLQADGPVTFTSQSGTPACEDWVGIFFNPGSSGHLDHTVVEYGQHAIQIATTNRITIANSTLRHNCHKPPTGNAWGAGLVLYDGTHLVTNTVIHDNRVETHSITATPGTWAEGGGVHMVTPAGPTLFENCTLYDNHASNCQMGRGGGDAGAGALNVLTADPIIRHCEIYSNTSTADRRAFGAGLYLGDSNAMIEADSFIHDNQTSGGTMAYGGGICLSEAGMPAPTRPIIRDSRVTSNVVQISFPPPTYVGPMKGIGGGVAFYENSQTRAVISNTLISGNTGSAMGMDLCGGGIGMAKGASADRFDGNLIHDNRLTSLPDPNIVALGAGICLSSTNRVTVTNNLIFDNRIGSMGIAFPRGGGIYANGANSYLVNNTIVSNTALFNGQGGGVYLADGVLSNTVVVSNTALYFSADGGGVYWAGGSVGYNDVWGNSCLSGTNYAIGGSPRPPTDIFADPLFIGSGDLATRYHLQLNSPCIDAGTSAGLVPGQDYDGDLRPKGSRHDIGFDEAWVQRTYLPLVLRSY
jgi:hypothetical protein